MRSSTPSRSPGRAARTRAALSLSRRLFTICLLGLAVLGLASCEGCHERTPNVCCTSDTECAELGLPPGSVTEYSCGQGHVCRDFYCIEEEPDASLPDAPPDTLPNAPAGRCNPNAPFGTPTLIPNVSSLLTEEGFAMTADERTAFISRFNGSEVSLLVASRPSPDDDFTAPVPAAEITAISNVAGRESWLWPTGDGLVIYYQRQVSLSELPEVFASYRLMTNEVFSPGSRVFVDGAPIRGLMPQVSPDGLRLYWVDYNDLKLYSAQHGSTNNIFVQRRPASTMMPNSPVISSNGLTLYYATGFDVYDIFVSTRSSRDVPFGVGLPVPNINSTESDRPLFVTADDCALFLASDRPGSVGGTDIWVAYRSQ